MIKTLHILENLLPVFILYIRGVCFLNSLSPKQPDLLFSNYFSCLTADPFTDFYVGSLNWNKINSEGDS